MALSKKTSKKIADNKKRIVKAAKKVSADPTVIAKAGKTQIKDFIDFLRTQSVFGLAVGLVLGGAVSTFVTSLVDNIVMPPLGLLLGSAKGLKGLTLTIGSTRAGDVAVLNYGVFLNDFFNFIVIAIVVYFLVRLMKVEPIVKINKK